MSAAQNKNDSPQKYKVLVAVDIGADMVIMGNRGNSGDMQTIFFGSTTERVLRFMSRPVLCVPIAEDHKE